MIKLDIVDRHVQDSAMRTIVIESRGGVPQAIYADAPTLRVILVDWDEDQSPSNGVDAAQIWNRVTPLGELPTDTLSLVQPLL